MQATSRHRSGTALHYGRDDFADEQQLRQALARERPKDMALDYEARTSPPQVSGPAKGAASVAVANATASPANSERAKDLRAMVAARVNAPKPTPESVREALAAAAKAVPGLGRDRDNGAER